MRTDTLEKPARRNATSKPAANDPTTQAVTIAPPAPATSPIATTEVTELAPPAYLFAHVVDNGHTLLDWLHCPAFPGAEFVIERSADGGEFVPIGVSKTLNFDDTTAVADASYRYRACARAGEKTTAFTPAVGARRLPAATSSLTMAMSDRTPDMPPTPTMPGAEISPPIGPVETNTPERGQVSQLELESSDYSNIAKVVVPGGAPPMTVLDKLNDEMTARNKQRDSARDANRKAGMLRYIEILLRADPQSGDSEDLEEMMNDSDLGLSADQVARDANLIRNVHRIRKVAAGVKIDAEGMNKLQVAIKVAKKAMEDAERNFSRAIGHNAMIGNANNELRSIATQHPRLFQDQTTPGQPPRFLGEA